MTAPSGEPPRDVLILAAGEQVDGPLPPLPAGALVIAADGGLGLAPDLGLRADVVVGDMDSVDPDHLAAAQAAGAFIDAYPVDKDRTDLAIALDLALGYAPARVTLVGGHGGRLDHHLANLLLIAAESYAPLEITALMGGAIVSVIRGSRTLTGQPGATVSLLPVHGPANGITTQGLRFALHDDELLAGSSRGVSNEFIGDNATVWVERGAVLAVQPGPHPDANRRKA